MKPHESREDAAVGRALRARARELDAFIPPAPPFEAVTNPPLRAAPVRLRSATNHRGLPIRLAALVAVGALVVAAGLVGTAGNRHGPSPTAAPPTPAAATATSATASSTTTPARAASQTVPPVVYTFDRAPAAIRWSPGATRIALTFERFSPRTTAVRILDRTGHLIETVDLTGLPVGGFAWIDEERYLLVVDGHLSLGRVGNKSREPLKGQFRQLLGAVSGTAIAVTLDVDKRDAYQIWANGSLGPVKDGIPLSFSRDGAMLAVFHNYVSDGSNPPKPTKAPGAPTLEVIETGTGRSLFKSTDVDSPFDVFASFSPDGRYLAFNMKPIPPDYWFPLGVVDIRSNKLWVARTTPQPNTITTLEVETWTSSAALAVKGNPDIVPADLPVTLESGSIDGLTIYGPVAAGPDGYWASVRNSSNKLTIHTPARNLFLDLPDTNCGVWWAPDGSELVTICGQAEAELSLVKP